MGDKPTQHPVPPERGPGRPPKPLPEPLDATPEEVAASLFNGPPKKRWRFLDPETD